MSGGTIGSNPYRNRYLRCRNEIRRILLATEKAIRRQYRLFSLTGIPHNDELVAGDVVRSQYLTRLLPDYGTWRYWRRGGLRSFLAAFRPKSVDDLAFANALYRPGPLASGMAEQVMGGGRDAPHPSLRNILGPTRGCLVYQEQYLEVAGLIAGMSTSEANELRRETARRSYDGEREKALRGKFLRGAIGKGLQPGDAARIFEMLKQESIYAFNRTFARESMLCLYSAAYLGRYFAADLKRARRALAALDGARVV